MSLTVLRGAASLCLAPLALVACAPNVALETAPQVVSSKWSRPAPTADDAETSADISLGSAELAALLDEARTANVDIAAAGARVRQARALLGLARSRMLPAVSGSAGVSSSRTGHAADPFDFSDAFGGLDVSFELDLFGAGRAERKAGRQRLRAAEFDRAATLLMVESEVSRAFVRRSALAARIALLDRNVEQARELERIIRVRFKAGEATRVDLGLQTIELRQLETERLRLVEALDRTRTALAVLTGKEAPLFAQAPASLEGLRVPNFASLRPTDIVARPDVRAAEARILAAGGNVDAARAAFFPRLRLGASALGQAASLSGPTSTVLSIGADLLAPIFDRGRLRANLDLSAAEQAESVENYRRTLLTSLAEVEDALSAVQHARERESLLIEVVDEARLTARLARRQYLEGEADLQRVLEAERGLVQAEDVRTLARQERLEAAIALRKALGAPTGRPLIAQSWPTISGLRVASLLARNAAVVEVALFLDAGKRPHCELGGALTADPHSSVEGAG